MQGIGSGKVIQRYVMVVNRSIDFFLLILTAVRMTMFLSILLIMVLLVSFTLNTFAIHNVFIFLNRFGCFSKCNGKFYLFLLSKNHR